MDGRQSPSFSILAGTAALLLAAACGEATSPGADTMEDDSMDTDPPTQAEGLTDQEILARTAYDSTWTWWEHSDSLLDSTTESPHDRQIRVRYNERAATQLDDSGRLVAGAAFPDSSAVVKEIYTDGFLSGRVVMFKATGDPNAGHGAWLWFEHGNGQVVHSITENEGVCHSCHVTGADHMRMPDSH